MLKKPLLKASEVDKMKYVYEILAYSSVRYKDRLAYRQPKKRDGEETITFGTLRRHVDCLRACLKNGGFEGGHIALIGESSIEWITTYLAVISGTGICVPIDRELREDTIVKQLNDADVSTVFCSVKSWQKIRLLLDRCPQVKNVVLMRTDAITEGMTPQQLTAKTLGDCITEGCGLLEAEGDAVLPAKIDPDATCVIIYTSGTTGANKGVMLSNRNIMGTLRGCARLLSYPGASISVLPINHSFELHAHLMSCLYCGTTVFLNDDLKHLLKNLKVAAPEMSCMVPMMLEMLERRIRQEIHSAGEDASFKKAVRLSNCLKRCGIDKSASIFSRVREPLGGKLKMIICGGAALSQETIDFFDIIGVKVYNGYGITECAPVAAVNPRKYRKKNSVGYILPTMRAKIENPDENGNGEIMLHGDNVMQGYFHDPESTKTVISSDGWLHTGDLGHISKDGYLYITGRLKDLIILMNGKNIYPEEIEGQMMQIIKGIKECVVTENSSRNGLYAFVYPDPDFCRENGLDSLEARIAYMKDQFKIFNRDAPGFKRISDFEITEKEFEKSSTHKIQRYKIKGVHQNV